MNKVSAAVAAVLVSGSVVTTTAITMAPAHAQDRQPIATTVKTAAYQNRQARITQAYAGSWHFTGNLYSTKYACVDNGQQYEREGFPYQCRYAYFSFTKQYLWWLYIYN